MKNVVQNRHIAVQYKQGMSAFQTHSNDVRVTEHIT